MMSTLDAIQPMQFNVKHCYLNGLTTLCHAIRGEHALLFSHAWYFEYMPRDGRPLGDRILTIDEAKTELVMWEYYGIQVTNQVTDEPGDVVDVVASCLRKGLPVGIQVDPFFCPWTPVYKTDHGDHFVVIVGMNGTGTVFHCVDSFFSQRREPLSLQDLLGGYLGHKLIRVDGGASKGIQSRELLSSVTRHLTRRQQHAENSFHAMRRFAEDLETLESLRGEKRDFVLFDSVSLILNMTFLVNHRQLFVRLLKYLRDRDGSANLQFLESHFEAFSESWETIRQLTLKAFFVPNPRQLLRTISASIQSVSEEEERLLYQLRSDLDLPTCQALEAQTISERDDSAPELRDSGRIGRRLGGQTAGHTGPRA